MLHLLILLAHTISCLVLALTSVLHDPVCVLIKATAYGVIALLFAFEAICQARRVIKKRARQARQRRDR